MNDNIDFEKNMDKLEEIVKKLEKGNLPLEESFKLFKEGLLLSQKLNNVLNDIEGKITMLINNDEEVPFNLEEDKDV
ncbi:exodeoxyribonuclease VII small subunit [Thermoanaerobacterium thermosaccharolyticum]|jgi:exodeoxyribonuclease VII small subunit|uniref:Exodeoxyribonuclease 7 small subunit n=3 Tax=Thermoanaerobacterium thermosaccharolyticum TaxID=1517 RepID=D9TQC4_THETC|nr:exodeoxyribonuclease VII small subunit [Thermoanaerobacterium thermosaccharolyticum]TCW37254.1 exodeoxyribonuclease VII small subunit [Thermohydrogenium kirishiense]ADL68825.1 exodeoxyribonuclease VII, small subunit [Thermoanaerobacterium thermosaccharolyticum DSM 571]AGB18919.1 Exodeoxyribonuclease VII small subunit [Thermoanaerobacterium thermosaccharolyticum M0795]AST59135.1 exodeoxyribonuclease VII small subunit [Thermoanaerobacterium thermosaccharolyticum]KAA5807636.1 exodeoxyribonucle